MIKLYRAAFTHLWPVCETLLIIVGLFAMLNWLPLRVFSDGDSRLFAIYNLVHHRQISPMQYSMIGPAFSIPLVIIDKFTPTMYWWQKHYNVFLLATGMFLVSVLLWKEIDQRLLRKFFLVLLVASMFGNNVTYYGGEMFTTLSVGFGILVMLLGPARAGWSAIVLGVANTPATLLGLGAMVLKHALTTRRLESVLAIMTAVGLIFAEAWIRRGSPFNTGYAGQTFSTPFFIGLLSILFSFGKGGSELIPNKQTAFSQPEP